MRQATRICPLIVFQEWGMVAWMDEGEDAV